MSYFVTEKPGLGYRELRWLGVAILLHLLLLAFPRQELPRRPLGPSAELVLRLITAPASLAPPAVPETPVEPLSAAVPEPEQQQAQPRAFPEPKLPEPRSEPPLATASPRPPVSAARLMGLRDSVTEQVPEPADSAASSAKLGTPRPFEPPRNWQPGTGAEALAPFDNTFNGSTVPGEVVILDRWLAADGSHNVMVETPNGVRMCGRAQAFDPTRPLVEPVMMWKVCGGDGAREFDFKPREPLDRDFIVPGPVAKDTSEP